MRGINHNHLAIIAAILFGSIFYLNPAASDGFHVSEVLSTDASRAGLLLVLFFAILFFLRGTNTDVLRVIFGKKGDESLDMPTSIMYGLRAVAVSILLLGILVAIALSFS